MHSKWNWWHTNTFLKFRETILKFLEEKISKFLEETILKKKIFFLNFYSNCFPDAIAILAFLSDLVRDVKKYAVPTDMPLIHCDQLMKDDFTKVFSAEVRRNYLLDKKLDEKGKVTLDEEGERIVLNGMIAIKMKNDNLTIEQLHELEEKLRKSSEELQRKLVQTDCDKYFETIVEQYAGKEKEYQKLKETLAEKRTYLKMITLTHEEKAKELAAKQAMVQEMAHRIKHQKYTVIDIKQVLAKETTIKNSIGMIQTETDAIKVDAANVQVGEKLLCFNWIRYLIQWIYFYFTFFVNFNVCAWISGEIGSDTKAQIGLDQEIQWFDLSNNPKTHAMPFVC